jgi:hypothetical protein
MASYVSGATPPSRMPMHVWPGPGRGWWLDRLCGDRDSRSRCTVARDDFCPRVPSHAMGNAGLAPRPPVVDARGPPAPVRSLIPDSYDRGRRPRRRVARPRSLRAFEGLYHAARAPRCQQSAELRRVDFVLQTAPSYLSQCEPATALRTMPLLQPCPFRVSMTSPFVLVISVRVSRISRATLPAALLDPT